jgi:DNA-nicking Smr family endonuclease
VDESPKNPEGPSRDGAGSASDFEDLMATSGVRVLKQDGRGTPDVPRLDASRTEPTRAIPSPENHPRIKMSIDDQRIEGCVDGVNRNLLRRLRRGAFPINERLDLHGLRFSNAEERVRRSIIEAWGRGCRLLLIIHGKGRRSERGVSAIKESLPTWLCAPPTARYVLAFTTATTQDGGAGATYVRLRKNDAQLD